ncbi:13061_t:CDS:2 [Funneliformis mosseae]|uniref:13061_t:CDS:1 n=1 Tax=Funneliformis mosseae TaxID=27381 RepID=A0A9N9BKI4_FUNMO|nr:13061_t:CDS:2 [Funneliformis mosseae]
MNNIHLVVFAHGLWGNHSHLQYLVERFEKKHSHNVHILNSKNNSSAYTYDGVDVCGDRLIYTEVKSLQDKTFKVTKFSIVGYSLGGLISRYAIGILYKRGFFKTVKPILFTTFATPHLGIRREDDKTFTKITNWVSTTLLSKTGEQLTFMDKYEEDEPILLTISRPDKIYFKALSAFKYRTLYANVRNDRTVPFWTAAISEVDPFDNVEELKISEKIPFMKMLTNQSKKVARYLLVGLAIPIVLPLWIVFILSTITIQGILSRRRVQKILASKAKNEVYDSNHEISVRTTSLEEDAVEAAMNIRNFLTPSSPTTPNSANSLLPSINPLENFTTTSSEFPHVQLCNDQRKVFANLNQLTWEKYAVYLDAFNSHAAIVMRNSLQTKGKEIIKHFVNEIFKDN